MKYKPYVRREMDQFQGLRHRIDYRTKARVEYEARVASKDTVLDVGGRNQQSLSNRRLRQLSSNPKTRIISTDIMADYNPDLVDDICHSRLETSSYDAVYCDAILEHVQDYEAAINHIHRILKPGGELFFYAPFFWAFHDRMDYHRFTFAEVDRILSIFNEHKLFLPDGNGYGGVLWQVLTFYQIGRFTRLFNLLSKCVNTLLAIPLTLRFTYERCRGNRRDISLHEYRFYYTHMVINHGFCGWARK
jgi:SAM-dependent methyltransferase